MVKEEWKNIPETSYSVSNYGKIRNDKSMHILKPGKNHKGYPLTPSNIRKYTTRYSTVHGWVAHCFIGPRPTEKHQANHKDGVKDNNFVGNLEWVTPEENIRHKSINDLADCIIKTSELPKLVERIKKGDSDRDIARDYGVCHRTIQGIRLGRDRSLDTGIEYTRPGPPKGEKHRDVKLTEAKVIELRNKLLEKRYTTAQLGKMYGVDRGTIQKIKREGSWKGIGPSTKHLINRKTGVNNGSKHI